MCAPLAGIEPATDPSVKRVLYPLSYSGTRAKDIQITASELQICRCLWILLRLLFFSYFSQKSACDKHELQSKSLTDSSLWGFCMPNEPNVEHSHQ